MTGKVLVHQSEPDDDELFNNKTKYTQHKFPSSLSFSSPVPEMTFENNAATCELLYTEQFARVFNCKLDRP